MPIKYKLEYNNPLGDAFICEIFDDDYIGEPIDLIGYCVTEKPKVDDPLDPIKGSSMTVNLTTNTSENLDSLIGDGGRGFYIRLSRNRTESQLNLIFQGFIDAEGWFEDYVTDKWEVSFNALDGLGLLEDLAFVDVDGFPFSGKQKDIRVIANCLNRTGIDNIVYASVNVKYLEMSDETDPLFHTYSNVDRFYKDDGDTIMSCKEVLESTLSKYGAFIFHDGRSFQIRSYFETVSPVGFGTRPHILYQYVNGNPISLGTVNPYDWPVQSITSQIKLNEGENTPHWVNGLRKEIEPAKSKLKVNYKYGFVKNLIENPLFNNAGVIADGWDIISGQESVVNYTSPIYVNIDTDTASPPPDTLETTNTATLTEGDTFKFTSKYEKGSFSGDDVRVYYKVILIGVSDIYYLSDNGSWGAGDTFISSFESASTGTFEFSVESSPLPVDGEVKVVIKQPRVPLISQPGYVRYKEISLTINQGAIQGENHVTTINNGSLRIAENIEVIVGDNESDAYTGTLYQDDETTPTAQWLTASQVIIDIEVGVPILELLARRAINLKGKNLIKFRGDVYGYLPYFGLFDLDLFPGKKFFPLSYRYETNTGIISYEFIERLGYGGAINYQLIFDYGNVVEPTIEG